MQYPSKLVEDAVTEISRLPSIGKKTALRLALFLLKEEPSITEALVTALSALRKHTQYCLKCHSIADGPLCAVCASNKRDQTLVCVVEDTKDVIAIENTNQYNGLYHVLGGIISPLHGIGPSQVQIDSLLERVTSLPAKEVILALPSTMDGDTTAFYITRKLAATGTTVSTIARGIPMGGELEYTDEITLGRSILARTLSKNH